jgi:hypothetical protein
MMPPESGHGHGRIGGDDHRDAGNRNCRLELLCDTGQHHGRRGSPERESGGVGTIIGW